MEKNVLRAIDGIALYPLISFGIFGLFFLGLLAYVLMVRPEVVGQMKNLPLAEHDDDHGTALVGPLKPRKGGAPC
jgi:hypothetical protein